MESRIFLIRHGRSAHVHREGWVTAAGVHRWRESYDDAGIVDDDTPPPALVDEVGRVGLIVSSDLPRAVASAERLASGLPVSVVPLLRETPITIPKWMPLPLPLAAWNALISAQWGMDIMRGVDAPAKEMARATTAARWLISLADRHSTVAVVTHGVFRRLLGLRLAASGWQPETRLGGYQHWSVWPFTGPPASRPASRPIRRRQ